MGPTSPMISSTKPAGGPQKFKTETISSSPLQTTETPPITPQETSTTSSLLNSSCPTDGNSTVTQPSDCGWQYNVTHTSLKQNTPRNTSKLYIGLCSAAMILLTILAAILTKTKNLGPELPKMELQCTIKHRKIFTLRTIFTTCLKTQRFSKA
ncbi:PREDICTED: hepatitis A virus cellular receptor 1 homolog isoform X2 [Myotis davidii]|uniref:hepatitis A virus cellular receptor 1 homolog isoform X2 n=1 Tax=Myotis davidii TaxID=225400 RepID=UPI0007672FCB|nr:PREDICTED: hepatitis A virus cellular receptor 1 homolog isoform X2 [Myotis davidii]